MIEFLSFSVTLPTGMVPFWTNHSKLHIDRLQTTDHPSKHGCWQHPGHVDTLGVSLRLDIMSPVTIVQEVDGGLATTHEAEGVLRLRRKNIQIHHRGDGRNVADLTALSHDLGNLAFLRPNGPD